MLDVLPIGTKEENWYQDKEAVFTVPPETRSKHVAIFGATGAGKGTLLRNMIAWDIDAGVDLANIEHSVEKTADNRISIG